MIGPLGDPGVICHFARSVTEQRVIQFTQSTSAVLFLAQHHGAGFAIDPQGTLTVNFEPTRTGADLQAAVDLCRSSRLFDGVQERST